MIEFLKKAQIWAIIILGTWFGINMILFLGPILLVGLIAILISSIPVLIVLLVIILLIRAFNNLKG